MRRYAMGRVKKGGDGLVRYFLEFLYPNKLLPSCASPHCAYKVDVYSFGLLLLDMATEDSLVDFLCERWRVSHGKKKVTKNARKLINGMSGEEAWRPVTDHYPLDPRICPLAIASLIVRCCASSPKDRPPFDKVLFELHDIASKEVESGGKRFCRVKEVPPPGSGEEDPPKPKTRLKRLSRKSTRGSEGIELTPIAPPEDGRISGDGGGDYVDVGSKMEEGGAEAVVGVDSSNKALLNQTARLPMRAMHEDSANGATQEQQVNYIPGESEVEGEEEEVTEAAATSSSGKSRPSFIGVAEDFADTTMRLSGVVTSGIGVPSVDSLAFDIGRRGSFI